MKMVIDMMGSDNGSKATVGGVLRFLEKNKKMLQIICNIFRFCQI